MMKFLTLDRWGAANLDNGGKRMGMNLSLEKMRMNLNLTSRKNGGGGRRRDVYTPVFRSGWYNQPGLKMPATGSFHAQEL